MALEGAFWNHSMHRGFVPFQVEGIVHHLEFCEKMSCEESKNMYCLHLQIPPIDLEGTYVGFLPKDGDFITTF